jgi:hypothetical protein
MIQFCFTFYKAHCTSAAEMIDLTTSRRWKLFRYGTRGSTGQQRTVLWNAIKVSCIEHSCVRSKLPTFQAVLLGFCVTKACGGRSLVPKPILVILLFDREDFDKHFSGSGLLRAHFSTAHSLTAHIPRMATQAEAAFLLDTSSQVRRCSHRQFVF